MLRIALSLLLATANNAPSQSELDHICTVTLASYAHTSAVQIDETPNNDSRLVCVGHVEDDGSYVAAVLDATSDGLGYDVMSYWTEVRKDAPTREYPVTFRCQEHTVYNPDTRDYRHCPNTTLQHIVSKL